MAQSFAPVHRHQYQWRQQRAAAVRRFLDGAARDINYGWISGLSAGLEKSNLCRRTLTGLQAVSAVEEKRAGRNGKRSLRRISTNQSQPTLKLLKNNVTSLPAVPTLEASAEVLQSLVQINSDFNAGVVHIEDTVKNARAYAAEAFRKGRVEIIGIMMQTQAQMGESIQTIRDIQDKFALIIGEIYGEQVLAVVLEQTAQVAGRSVDHARREISNTKMVLFNEGADLFLAEDMDRFAAVREAIDVFAELETDLEILERHFKNILSRIV